MGLSSWEPCTLSAGRRGTGAGEQVDRDDSEVGFFRIPDGAEGRKAF